ncbi:MAG: hypothetical protein FK733_09565 [Asgard group archaeon]|nr:hypothetical protein [Asgard group archaeon]
MSKRVVDKYGKELGTVIRVEDYFDSVTMEQATPFAVIEIPKRFRKAGIFPFPLVSSEQFQVMEDTVYLNITKKEFTKMFNLYNAERKLKAKTAKLREATGEEKALALMIHSRF